MSTILRVSGKSDVIKSILKDCDGLIISREFKINRQGDFIVTLSDEGKEWEKQLLQISDTLILLKEVLFRYDTQLTSLIVDTSIWCERKKKKDLVGMTTVNYSPEVLALCSDMNISIEVTVYN